MTTRMPDPVTIATTGWWLHEGMAADLGAGAAMVKLWTADAFAGDLAAGVRALVTYSGSMTIDAARIASLPALEIIVVLGAGVDSVDVDAAGARGIAVRNCPAANTEDVAELAFGLLLAAGRGIARSDAAIRQGRWENVTRHRVSGRPIGIFGMGNVGQAVARRAAGFDMPVFYTSRRARPDLPWQHVPTLDALAARVDQLVLAAPATPETRHAVNEGVLEKLGPRGILVNVARGSIVDERALIACLKDGRLGAAGLDVYEHEPGVPDALRALPNVVMTPHDGGDTFDSFDAIRGRAVAILKEHFGRNEVEGTP